MIWETTTLWCTREGTLIRIKDGTMILKPRFRDYLLKLATENDIKHQYYISPGGTDGERSIKQMRAYLQQ